MSNFRAGAVYRYFAVPAAVHFALMSAESAGAFAHQVMRRVFAVGHRISVATASAFSVFGALVDELKQVVAGDEGGLQKQRPSELLPGLDELAHLVKLVFGTSALFRAFARGTGDFENASNWTGRFEAHRVCPSLGCFVFQVCFGVVIGVTRRTNTAEFGTCRHRLGLHEFDLRTRLGQHSRATNYKKGAAEPH